MPSFQYPPAPRTGLVETHHGIAVADPFQTLENADDPATVAWVAAENALTRRLLEGPRRDGLVARLRELHRFARTSVPVARGRRLFFMQNDGTRNQAVLCVRDPQSLDGRVLVDPNALDPGGTTALTALEPDEGGARLVYALSRHGSDVQELRVLDVASGRDLPDLLQWVKFASVAWTVEGDGFFYTRFPRPGDLRPGYEHYFCQVWFHRLGDPQSADGLVLERPDAPEIVFEVDLTSDGRQLVVISRQGASDHAEVHVSPVVPGLSRIAPPRTLVAGFSSGWHFIDGADGKLYFLTDMGAPRGRIVCFDIADESAGPREIVAESDETISIVAVAGSRLVVCSLRNACSRLRLFDLGGGSQREIPLPGIGSITGVGARWADPRCSIAFESFTTPPTILECDVDASDLAMRTSTVVPSASSMPVDPTQYTIRQEWCRSKDGTPVSLFIVHRKDAVFPAPALLTGYGGFNVSLTPSFDPSDFLWLDGGGIIATANLRGGGEYGEAWHQAGMRDRKQNVFDDFIAAAEWLVARGHAARGRVAIEGASNGGLLVGAVMVQRPDLFGAVICRVPVADMLRYHLFTVGRFWIPEYGCADDPQQFAYLYRYSPYHNVRDGVRYPPTLVMTADADDRVDPHMAKKFAARLQEAQRDQSRGPILLRVETRAGHGAGKPIGRQIQEQADVCEFLFQRLTQTTANEQQ